jgi:hypothetical protein
MFGIRRRQFIALLGGAAAAWPLAARAQQLTMPRRLGVLLYSTPQAESQMERVRSGLRELGYAEGRNLLVSYYYAEGKPERLPDLAAALVRESPDLLFALGSDVAPHAAKATSRRYQSCSSPARTPFNLGLLQALPGPPATRRALRSCRTILHRNAWSFSRRRCRASRVWRFCGIRTIPITSCARPSGRRTGFA